MIVPIHVYIPSLTEETNILHREYLGCPSAFSFHSCYFGADVPLPTNVTILAQIGKEYCSVILSRAELKEKTDVIEQSYSA